MFCWPCICRRLETSTECPVCSKQIDKSTLVPIYGQAKEAADVPPPPKAPPPKQEPRRQNFYPGAAHFQFGVFGPGIHIEFGNGGVQFHLPGPRQIAGILCMLILIAVTFTRSGLW
jgi:hypothetical protein